MKEKVQDKVDEIADTTGIEMSADADVEDEGEDEGEDDAAEDAAEVTDIDLELGEEEAPAPRSRSRAFALSEFEELMALTQSHDKVDAAEKGFIFVMRWLCVVDILVIGIVSSYYTFTARTTVPSWSFRRDQEFNYPTYGTALRDGFAIVLFTFVPICSNLYMVMVSTSSASTHIGEFVQGLNNRWIDGQGHIGW